MKKVSIQRSFMDFPIFRFASFPFFGTLEKIMGQKCFIHLFFSFRKRKVERS